VTGRPAAFLDRDGVLNEFVRDPLSGVADSPLRVENVRLIPGAAAAAARLAHAGFTLVCVSNQPAAAKAKASIEQLLDVHRRVVELLAQEGAAVRASRLCWHHPEGTVPALTEHCACRKPQPGMLLDAATEIGANLSASWMVGDSDTDIGAGQAAGCRTVLVAYGATAHKRLSNVRPDLLATDLADAVEQILTVPNWRHFKQSHFDSLRAG
jgi:D-glycero-D-manno-heptose 1,7-bisphosphate phosphatase